MPKLTEEIEGRTGGRANREAAGGGGKAGEFSSSPCSMPELSGDAEPALAIEDVLAALNELLESERAGVSGALALNAQENSPELADRLKKIAKDEAWCCAMLTAQIQRLGGTPSNAIGAFFDNLMAVGEPDAQIKLLSRGQNWVLRRLVGLLPDIEDAELKYELVEMLRRHEVNIALLDSPA